MDAAARLPKTAGKACRGKSAGVMVPCGDGAREGLDPTGVNIAKHHQMKGRMRKIPARNDSLPQKDRPEAKGHEGVQAFMRVADGYPTTGQPERECPLLEQILSPGNLNAAYRQVGSNGGSPGMDKTDCDRLPDYLKKHGERLTEGIRQRTYRPDPVRRAEMPKDNGKKRRLGIPTAVDRVIQQAIAQTLTPIHERQSSGGSHGFRPRRGGKKALAKATGITGQGCHHAADTGLERFFGTAGHAKLTGILQRTIKDGAVISLIHKYLNAGVMANGKHEETREGTPQGDPLSPLLANILPNGLDKELERRGHPFVRQAQDRAQRISAGGGGTEYYKPADMGSKVKETDQWLRRRIRMCIWKAWKRPGTRVRNLIKCGIPKQKAYEWGNTSKGYWCISGSWIATRAMPDEALHRAGHVWIGCYYKASALPKG